LPDLLVAKPGLNSGFMIPQYTAVSIVSQNKILCHPASVDSIETCQGQEDHVSMGATAAVKAYKVLGNLKKVLAIELMNAAQAFEFRRPKKTSPMLEDLLLHYREKVPFVEDDVFMFPLIEQSVKFIEEYDIPKI
jgi:histidine ammonia-lyase